VLCFFKGKTPRLRAAAVKNSRREPFTGRKNGKFGKCAGSDKTREGSKVSTAPAAWLKTHPQAVFHGIHRENFMELIRGV
jgi:hypothetical protein